MKLEDIINAYNEATQDTLIVLRTSKSVSSFSKGLQEQTIRIVTDKEVTMWEVKDVAIEDKTTELEYKLLVSIFDAMNNWAE